MGHRNSPAQLGRDGGICDAHRRSAEDVAASGPACERRPSALITSSTHTGAQIAANPTVGSEHSIAAWLLLLAVRLYIALLSPIFGGACKFHPSCSNYAREAISLHGARRGAALALKRLGRCRPFTRGGFDPVPGVEEFESHNAAGVGMREGLQ